MMSRLKISCHCYVTTPLGSGNPIAVKETPSIESSLNRPGSGSSHHGDSLIPIILCLGERDPRKETKMASVVRQTDGALSRVALARMTFARMSDAFLVQMNGFGSSLWRKTYSSIASMTSCTLRKMPRRIRLSVRSRKKRSTMFSQEALVGVKWTWKRAGACAATVGPWRGCGWRSCRR